MTAPQTSAEELKAVTRHMLWVICRDAEEYAALDDLVKRDLVVANMVPLGCGVGDFVDRVFRPVWQRRMLLQPFPPQS